MTTCCWHAALAVCHSNPKKWSSSCPKGCFSSSHSPCTFSCMTVEEERLSLFSGLSSLLLLLFLSVKHEFLLFFSSIRKEWGKGTKKYRSPAFPPSGESNVLIFGRSLTPSQCARLSHLHRTGMHEEKRVQPDIGGGKIGGDRCADATRSVCEIVREERRKNSSSHPPGNSRRPGLVVVV